MTDALPFSVEPTRRDMLFVATGAAAVIAAGFSLWPLVANMNPDASTRAAGAPLDVDIGALAPGQMVSVRWRGLPVFIINRPEAALRSLRDPALLANLRDPESAVRQQPDYARNWSRSATPQLGVYVAICTHLGCIPLYYPEPSPSVPTTGWRGGVFCPCHGSKYDLAGRVFSGVPAPYNLPVPPYRHVDARTLRIGENPEGVGFDVSSVVQM
jgi:ubiquinol-cytochrome c reductase iron-sulfur subunit